MPLSDADGQTVETSLDQKFASALTAKNLGPGPMPHEGSVQATGQQVKHGIIMEQLIQACRAYASELPPQTLTWTDHAFVIALLIFSMIGICWTTNKIVEFAFRQPRHF